MNEQLIRELLSKLQRWDVDSYSIGGKRMDDEGDFVLFEDVVEWVKALAKDLG